jgi:N-dimethylarginine dimethylaminohydrolase
MTFAPLTEFGPLRRVALRRPAEAFVDQPAIDGQWQALNYTARPDLARAAAEHDRFAAILKESGAAIDFLPADPALGLDSIYVRDAAIVVPNGLILCNMGKPARTAEPEVNGQALARAGVPVVGAIAGNGRIEGGDLVWLDDRTLAVGRTYRTNDDGIRQLKALVGSRVEVIVAAMPHYRGPGDVFHLMSVLSPLDKDLALVYSPLMPIPFRERLIGRGIRLVEVPDAEFDSMGCNVLALAPRRCLMVSGNPLTRAALEQAGVTVIEYDGMEISAKGQGGPTCLTRPLLRG